MVGPKRTKKRGVWACYTASTMPTTGQPLAEIFGFPADNFSDEAARYRSHKLCPYNNKVPNCTKDKANDPLGVCSVYADDHLAITCPVRFRQNWLIAEHGADFFFPPKTRWTSLTEVKLKDKYEKSAGNIDLVLVSYDDRGKVLDFGALEVQAVYILCWECNGIKGTRIEDPHWTHSSAIPGESPAPEPLHPRRSSSATLP